MRDMQRIVPRFLGNGRDPTAGFRDGSSGHARPGHGQSDDLDLCLLLSVCRALPSGDQGHRYHVHPQAHVDPHVGGLSESFLKGGALSTARHILEALRGVRPSSLVNPEAWDRAMQRAARIGMLPEG